jgi:hypothetical protein
MAFFRMTFRRYRMGCGELVWDDYLRDPNRATIVRAL